MPVSIWPLCKSKNPFQVPFDTVVSLCSVDLCGCRMSNRIQVLIDVVEKSNLPATSYSGKYYLELEVIETRQLSRFQPRGNATWFDMKHTAVFVTGRVQLPRMYSRFLRIIIPDPVLSSFQPPLKFGAGDTEQDDELKGAMLG